MARDPKRNWIKLNRAIMDDWIWKATKKNPFDKRSAWIDLLLLAYSKDTINNRNGELVEVKRGQVPYSKAFLSERWKWSIPKVTRFLMALERDGKCSINSTTHGTTITIEKYAFWQDTRSTDVTTDVMTDVTTDVKPTLRPALRPALTDKNNRIDKDNIERGAAPSLAQVTDLVKRENLQMDPEAYINYYQLNDWTMSNGLRITGDNWEYSVRMWAKREKAYSSGGGGSSKPNIEPPKYKDFEPEPERKAEPMTEEQRRKAREALK